MIEAVEPITDPLGNGEVALRFLHVGSTAFTLGDVLAHLTCGLGERQAVEGQE